MKATDIIVRAMIEMAKENPEVGFVNAISGRIYEYKQRGEDVSCVTLQRVPGGFYSPEVAELVGKLLTVGIIHQESPIIIDRAGIEELKRILQMQPA